MEKTVCDICAGSAKSSPSQDISGNFYSCKKCGKYIITDDAKRFIDNEVLINDENYECKFYNCLNFYFLHKKNFNKTYVIDLNTQNSEKYIFLSVAEIMNLNPNSLLEKINMTLLNLSKEMDNIGEEYDLSSSQLMRICMAISLEEIDLILNSMSDELSYIQVKGRVTSYVRIKITYEGWIKIDELRTNIKKYKKGFIAMMFDDSMAPIRETIKKVFIETGYQISIIDEKEHNNQIVQEILYEIETSDFIVADLTGNRGGVYYEAGYALGLGKEVILIVNNLWLEENNELPHFDVAQKNQIRYISIDDLSRRLYNRITSTVGNLKNPNSPLKSIKTNNE
jgi:nucleoside 2-deoxyribosyltransferase